MTEELDISCLIEDAEHACFKCAICNEPMHEYHDVEIAQAFAHQCLVHTSCALDFVNSPREETHEPL